jgi:hypothetical protein
MDEEPRWADAFKASAAVPNARPGWPGRSFRSLHRRAMEGIVTRTEAILFFPVPAPRVAFGAHAVGTAAESASWPKADVATGRHAPIRSSDAPRSRP